MFPAKAKRVIFLYMSGGVSHVDTFDPKPKLTADHHKRYKEDFLHASPWTSKAYAQIRRRGHASSFRTSARAWTISA